MFQYAARREPITLQQLMHAAMHPVAEEQGEDAAMD